MANTPRQLQKEATRQLGCRATEREKVLITYAAKLERRDRNSFVVKAAVDQALRLLEAAGITEEELEKPKKKRKAA